MKNPSKIQMMKVKKNNLRRQLNKKRNRKKITALKLLKEEKTKIRENFSWATFHSIQPKIA